MSKKQIEPTNSMVGGVELGHKLMQMDIRAILRAALNHPDAAGLFADEHALRAAREQGWDQAVDWIRGDQGGPSGRTTNARLANPHRPVQELPTEKGAVIVPADGRGYIEATRYGRTWRAMQAALDFSGDWVGAWCSEADVIAYIAPEEITPGTWKVDD